MRRSDGFGEPWGHTRIYSNRLSSDFDFGNGYNWLVRQWPYLVDQGGAIVVMRGTRSTLWFDLVGGVYVGRYGAKHTLSHDTAEGVFNLAAPNGTLTTFQDFAGNVPGAFQASTTAAGLVTQVSQYTGQQIAEIHRSYPQAGASSGSSSNSSSLSATPATIESYLYTYAVGGDGVSRIATVLLRRQVAGGDWTNVRVASYAYYGYGDPNGSLGDMQSANQYVWGGGEAGWVQNGYNYYRYWTAGAPSASSNSSGAPYSAPHLLKFVLNTAAYVNMLNDDQNPLTAADVTLAQYADGYFEYDSNRRISKEIVDAGLHTYTLTYTTNTNPDYVDDYNHWKMKTIETRPDGSTNTVYTNYVGEVLLKQFAGAGQSWIEYVQFDGNANVARFCQPSAVAAFDDAQNDLGVTLRAASGLVRDYTYYAGSNSSSASSGSSSSSSSSSAGGVAAPGYLAAESVRQGSGGTPVVLKQYQYASQASGGLTIYPCVAEIAYRDDGGGGAVTTSYSHAFYAGTNTVFQRTTTLPTVSVAQNGCGVAATRVEQIDLAGNLAQLTDERGVLTQFVYDVVTRALQQRIDDAGGLGLLTDYDFDALGRTTRVLGPWHTVDIGGTATSVRTATWTSYQDGTSATVILTGQGYIYGTAPFYQTYMASPFSMTFYDGDGRVTDQMAVGGYAGAFGGFSAWYSYPQSDYVRQTRNDYNAGGQLIDSAVYWLIPSLGGFTSYAYDALGRQNRLQSPGNTITRTLYDPRGLPLSIWVGTNDYGATDADPSGGGNPYNNMVAVQIQQYDGGADGGDGNLTLQTLPADANSANDRVTTFAYDWRNRQVSIQGPLDFYQANTFDTLDRLTQVDRHDTNASGNLIGRVQTSYDDLGRVYQSTRYAVDPATGTVGNSLSDNTWFDAAGNVIKQLPAGSSAFAKFVYDNLGRAVTRHVGYDLSGETYSQASSVADDTIMEQVETTYDEAGNAIQVTSRQRFHNATGTGDLTSPGGAQPQARVTYVAAYPDGIGRRQAVADYGTNGDVALVRSATVPAASDTVLVSLTQYANDGTVSQTTDPAGTVTRYTFDNAGRLTQVVENSQPGAGGSSSSGLPSSDDTNVTTQWTYNADSLVATLTAVNAETGNQTTTYTYGTTLAASDIARNDLLASITYPDAGVVSYLYNRQSQTKQFADQRGVAHAYSFDLLGRLTQDAVTSFLSSSSSSSSNSSSGGSASPVDGTVQRIGRTYEVRGMLVGVTSYSSPVVGQGSVVNDVEFAYNTFGQLATEYQEHNGAVNTSSSLNAQYAYANDSANTTRPTSATYPNGRVLNYNYGTSGGMDDALSRVASLIDSDGLTHLADYTRIGLDSIVQVAYPQPSLAYSLINGSGADPYSGLDQFDRVADCRWFNTGTNADVERVQHGYDLASNRLWRSCPVARSNGVYQDEFYSDDGLYRLSELQRGELNGSDTGIVPGTLDFAQSWGLDATGNWAQFWENDTGSGWNLQQTRTASTFNEITGISGGGWIVPAYDPAGNMVTMPQPALPTSGYSATFDAWNRLMVLSSGMSTIAANVYDGLNRRVSKTVSGIARHYYYSAMWQVLEERLGGSTSYDRQFVWGLRYIDDLVLRDAAGYVRLYGLQDPNFNVTALSDASGTVQERYRYTAYGVPTVLTGSFGARGSSSYDWETRYAGYRWDAESGLYQVRHRFLVSGLGSWATRDLVAYAGGQTSLYVYAGGHPSGAIDPLGLLECDCKGRCAGLMDFAGSLDAYVNRQIRRAKTQEFTFYPHGEPERLADYRGKWGGRLNMAQSEADIAANLKGMRFWDDFQSGKIAAGTFSICDYLNWEWEE